MNTLFETSRMQITDSIKLTIESLNTYGPLYPDWCIAWSGGKDSTSVLTLTVHLIESGQVPAPQSLTVLYADTRMELLPLSFAAKEITEELQERGITVRTVMAPIERRMLVYILGRGVPPPNNNTLRYCTRQIKIEPMQEEVKRIVDERGRKILMLTGVRIGESAVRDRRIALSCSRNGAECGQGWFQEEIDSSQAATLAPLLHWRVCHVWAWLKHWAPDHRYGEWPTRIIADAYGGEEAEEINARTGCVGCPLASQDTALDAVIKNPAWSYLQPLKHLRQIYEEMRKPKYRLRKAGGQRRQDGKLATNQQRLGPLTLEARNDFLEKILAIQEECNRQAEKLKKPLVDFLNNEEVQLIRKLISAKTWPNGWEGTEQTGDILLPSYFDDGSIQPILFGN